VPVLLASAEFEHDCMYTTRPTVYLNTVKARFFKGNACNGHHS